MKIPKSILRQSQIQEVPHIEVNPERDLSPEITAKVGRMKRYWAIQLERIYIKKKLA